MCAAQHAAGRCRVHALSCVWHSGWSMRQEWEMTAICKRCPEHHYRNSVDSGCSPCPPGSKSEAGSADISACTCLPGFSSTRDGSGNLACTGNKMLKSDLENLLRTQNLNTFYLPDEATSSPAVPPLVVAEEFRKTPQNPVACEDNVKYQDFNCSRLQEKMPNGTNCKSYGGALSPSPALPRCRFLPKQI